MTDQKAHFLKVRVLKYDSKYMHSSRKDVVKFLLENLNNDVEDGVEVGSSMYDELYWETETTMFLAWSAGKIVGWGSLKKNWDAYYQASTYVAPEFRRLGVGTQIANKMKKFVRDDKLISQGWDDKGIEFYKKAGIKYCGEIGWQY